MEHAHYMDQSTNLSAEVEPFVPRSDVGNMYANQMVPHPSGGPLPHYLTSCYPFVQDQSDNGQRMNQNEYQGYYQNRDMNGWGPQGPPLPPQFPNQMPPRFNTPPPQVPAPNMQVPTHVYAYHTTPGPYTQGPNQYPGHWEFSCLSQMQGPYHQVKQHKRDSSGRKSSDSKKSSSSKKSGRRSIGIQMEVGQNEESPDNRAMVDNSQQTDFPYEIASKTLSERPSPLKKPLRSSRHRRRAAPPDQSVSCDSSDNGGGEADVDSDSGYYSPKHQISRRSNTRDDQHEVGTGTGVPQNYLVNSVPPQRVIYLHQQPPVNQSDFYQIQSNSTFMPGPPPSGHLIRLPPGNGTSPLIMAPQSMGPVQGRERALAIANFKSRSPWEQEILKAHNAAPLMQNPLNPRMRHPALQAPKQYNLGRGQLARNQRYPGPGGRQNHGTPPRGHDLHGYPLIGQGTPPHMGGGMLRLNPNTAPSHLIQQNPPQLTDEDFPGLQSSSSTSEHGGNSKAVFSYSAAVQNKPRPVTEIDISEDSPIKNLIEPVDPAQGKGSRRRRKKTERAAKAAAEEYAGISQEQENLKKQLSKKGGNKGRTQQLDIAEMLKSKLEEQKQAEMGKEQPTPESGKFHRNIQVINQGPQSMEFLPHNPLDSTAPSRKRGKEREIPKNKKPSALKKVILKEREEKKNNRVVSLTSEENPEYDVPSLPSGIFNSEYKKENGDENNNSDDVSSTGAGSSENPSPLTISISGNSSPVVPANLPKIHSRRYREYCSQVLDKQIDETCTIILQKLVQFQDRMYQKDPIKAKAKRRFVLGIREVTKHLKLRKLRCVFISPNLEKIQSKGGLDDAMQNILLLCKEQSVPYVFALGRCAMGRAVSKLVPVSIVGIFDYSGVEDQYKRMIDLVTEAQKKYFEMVSMYKQEAVEASAQPTVPPPTKRFAHMGHSRNPSAASCVSFCSMISEPISEMNPSEGTSWRNMMDVTDEAPPPALSPPVENALEDDPSNDLAQDEEEPAEREDESAPAEQSSKTDQEDKEEEDGSPQDEGEDSSNDNTDSYLNALDNSGSFTSEEQGNGEPGLDKSFSTVSTVVARSSKVDTNSEKGKQSMSKLSRPSSSPGIPSIVEHPPPSSSDTTARINSWLEAATTSVQELELDDPSTMVKEDNTDEDGFASANEHPDESQEESKDSA